MVTSNSSAVQVNVKCTVIFCCFNILTVYMYISVPVNVKFMKYQVLFAHLRKLINNILISIKWVKPYPSLENLGCSDCSNRIVSRKMSCEYILFQFISVAHDCKDEMKY